MGLAQKSLGWNAKVSNDNAEPKPVLQTSDEFTRDFVPPDYLVDGVLQRRFLYSITAPTGAGKTCLLLRLAYSVALCQRMGRCNIEAAGTVCFFAGENPDDIRMRWIAMAEALGFDIKSIPVHFVAGIYKIEDIKAEVERRAAAKGTKYSLIIIDTNSAYFGFADENSER